MSMSSSSEEEREGGVGGGGHLLLLQISLFYNWGDENFSVEILEFINITERILLYFVEFIVG